MKIRDDRGAPRRRKFYVDGALQRRLALALVALEVALFSGACAYLYFALVGIIDDNLYVIHAGAREGLLPQMARELGRVALVCGVINSLALVFTHRLWVRHIRRVLAALDQRLARVRALDLRPDPAPAGATGAHRLLDLCDGWIEAERTRVSAIDNALARLPASLRADPAGEAHRDALAVLAEAAGHLQRRVGESPRAES